MPPRLLSPFLDRSRCVRRENRSRAMRASSSLHSRARRSFYHSRSPLQTLSNVRMSPLLSHFEQGRLPRGSHAFHTGCCRYCDAHCLAGRNAGRYFVGERILRCQYVAVDPTKIEMPFQIVLREIFSRVALKLAVVIMFASCDRLVMECTRYVSKLLFVKIDRRLRSNI